MRPFAGRSDVLDVGCGRGEFLDVLARPASARAALDTDPEMVRSAAREGSRRAEADCARHLRALPDASLDGLFSAQVVEHLKPSYLIRPRRAYTS